MVESSQLEMLALSEATENIPLHGKEPDFQSLAGLDSHCGSSVTNVVLCS